MTETTPTTDDPAGPGRQAADDVKIAVVLRDDLAPWQELNVTAFVAGGLGTTSPGLIGLPYEDASGVKYHPMFGRPVVVLSGSAAAVRRAFDRALGRGLTVAVYTDDLFGTDNDVDNRAAVAAVTTDELRVAGFAVAGDRRTVDKALDKLRLHP
ncbi:MAG TPA: DUF2000 domain-containing protein [Acidimicrobiales bacterium]